MPVTNYRLKSGRTAQVLIAFVCASSICSSQPAARQSKLGAYIGTTVANTPRAYWWLDLNGNYTYEGPPADAQYNDFTTGQIGEVPVYGDWNGDGSTKIGVYVNGSWMIDYNGNGVWDGPVIDRAMYLGGPGYTPVMGDWNGSGTTKIGAHKDGVWLLDYNGNYNDWEPGIDKQIFFGGPGYTPVVGDWNGSHSAKIGAHLNGLWILDYNGNLAWDGPSVDTLIFFGGPGYTPVVGDWNGSGSTKIAAYLAGLWVVDFNGNLAWDGTEVDKLLFFGGPEYTKPMAGDWNGSGTSKVGAYAEGYGSWVLDINGNFVWDPPVDQLVYFGGPGSTPVVGAWPLPTFTLTAAPNTFSVVAGSNTTPSFILTITPINGFGVPVSFTAPAFYGCGNLSFSPASVAGPPWTTTLTMSCNESNPGYIYPTTVQASGGGRTQQLTLTLYVTSPGQYWLTTAVSPAGAGSINPLSGSYNSGATVYVSATPYANYQFTGFSGALTGILPGTVTMNANKSVTANFSLVTTPTQTITSVPAGLALTVDGTGCISPCSFHWVNGTYHTIATATQAGASGTQYLFGNWSDGGAASHTVTAPSPAATYTANFTAQYYLTTAASPTAWGTISPPSGWYTSSTRVEVGTTANGGYQFSGFTGGATGTTVPAYFVMNAPKTVTANFAAQGATIPPNLTEMGMLSLFVKRHTSLVVSGASPANGGLYGLLDNDVATVNSVVDSASQQLDQVQAQASSYANGNAYLNARNTVLQNLKSQLQSGVSSASWQSLDGYMNTTLAPALSAQSLDGGTPPRPLAQTSSRCDPAAVNCMFLWSEINFYNGGGTNHGLGARIESWVEGPNARDFFSTVSQVKESFTPLGGSTAQVIFSPLDVTVTGGGHAGRVNTDWAGPRAGTYKIEAFHSFTYTYTDATGTHTDISPPFPNFIFGDPPPSPAARFINPLNGYDLYQTPVALNLTVDGAQMDSTGQTATVTGCSAPITIAAVLTPPLPPGNAAPPITWTGGLPVDNLHRTVPCVLGTTSITVAIGTNLQTTISVKMEATLIKLEKVGETVISQDGQYSEDTTIRVTAVNSAGQTVTAFTGTVGIFELGSDIYSQNVGDLPPSVVITNGGSATFVAKSFARPYNGAAGPVDAMITSSNFAVYGGESLAIPQWIISGRKIDSRAGDNVYDWLQYRVKDIFAKYATDSDVSTVLNAIRSFNMGYLPNEYARTFWERSATSPITINPFYEILRLDSLAYAGACGLPASPKSLTDTVLHEGRHAYQAFLTIIPNNDKDQDFLPAASLSIPPTDIMRDTTDLRTVCDASANPDNQLSQRRYKGDVSYPASYDSAEGPDFASYAWEYDAWSFASRNVK